MTGVQTCALPIWSSDGTANGTRMFNWPNPDVGILFPYELTAVGNVAYFGANGSQLWKTDGTNTGTVLLTDLRFGTSNGAQRFLTNVNKYVDGLTPWLIK